MRVPDKHCREISGRAFVTRYFHAGNPKEEQNRNPCASGVPSSVLRHAGMPLLAPTHAAVQPLPPGLHPLSHENLPAQTTGNATMIIDSQLHDYEANTPKRPWASVRAEG